MGRDPPRREKVFVADVVHHPPERLMPQDLRSVAAGEVVIVGTPVAVDDGGAQVEGPVAEVRGDLARLLI